MDYQVKIDEILTQAVTEKTFSLEIIEKIKSLRDAVNVMEVQSKLDKKTTDDLNKTLMDVRGNYSDISIKLEAYKKRETELATKEKVAERQDYALQFQKARADEIKEMFMHVFRNPTIVRSASHNRNTPIASNGYVSTWNENGVENSTESIQ